MAGRGIAMANRGSGTVRTDDHGAVDQRCCESVSYNGSAAVWAASRAGVGAASHTEFTR